MLAALTVSGLQAPMTIEAPTDGDVFLAYLEQILCPTLHSGQIVAKARTLEALEAAIADALGTITIHNAKGWFAHCGYGLR